MKLFNCSWFKPYYETFSIETEETINDPNRGFIEDGSALIINNMEVGDVFKINGLIVVRLSDESEIQIKGGK